MVTEKNKVAAIQMASGPNVSANLLEAERIVGDAVEAGAKMVVLPENFAFMGETDEDNLKFKEEPGNGPLQTFISQLAERHDIWIAGGTIPLTATAPNKIRSSCLMFNDKGEQVARYDKIHLFDVHLLETDEKYSESSTIEPGTDTVVVDSPFGRIGMAICYDLRFPEQFRNLVDEGMEIAVLPAAFTAHTGKAHWQPLVQTRAIENLSYMITAAQGGYHVSGRETYGHSMIVDPWGTIQGQIARGNGFAMGEIDLTHLNNTRRAFPALEHRQITCRIDA
ncbi:MAG: carbon-nitrogen hydrolase family protein [Gammaproteobacteria bacterium]|nr:carbon-nitrogen hydrolase family protein [Gammaproteobacteria bacterium]